MIEEDPRIRLFIHLKNSGLLRSRTDGIIYSRGKYIITLEPDDLYYDNTILEYSYNLLNKYKLDSIVFSFYFLENKSKPLSFPFEIGITKNIIYGIKIHNTFLDLMKGFYFLWNHIVRNSVYFKSFNMFSDELINRYRNYREDFPQTVLMNICSNSFLSINRFGIFYNKLGDTVHEGDNSCKSLDQLNTMALEKLYNLEFIFDSYFYDKSYVYYYFLDWMYNKFCNNHESFYYHNYSFKVTFKILIKIVNFWGYTFNIKEIYFFAFKELLKRNDKSID
jgi:glycosyltransferase involved in cell wall biosynthesis